MLCLTISKHGIINSLNVNVVLGYALNIIFFGAASSRYEGSWEKFEFVEPWNILWKGVSGLKEGEVSKKSYNKNLEKF